MGKEQEHRIRCERTINQAQDRTVSQRKWFNREWSTVRGICQKKDGIVGGLKQRAKLALTGSWTISMQTPSGEVIGVRFV